MTLPTTPTSVTKTIPSYLYFEYQDDQDLPALIQSYNDMTQEYVDWFNDVNLPVYTKLNGALLDWVGQGVYGLPRPSLSSTRLNGVIGPYATVRFHGPEGPSSPTPDVVKGYAMTQIYQQSNVYDTPDDIYKRILTWWFYKGDGFIFSVAWLKRRIARYLYGVNGEDISMPWTPDISVTFDDSTVPQPTCNITISNTALLANTTVSEYFKVSVENGVLSLPFRFQYSVTLLP